MDPFINPSTQQNDVFCPLLLPCFLSLFLSPMTARGTKTEEFEYVETLLRNPQKIHLRKKIEQIEEEIDPRKEALVAYRVFVPIHTNKKKTTVITRNTRKGESAK